MKKAITGASDPRFWCMRSDVHGVPNDPGVHPSCHDSNVSVSVEVAPCYLQSQRPLDRGSQKLLSWELTMASEVVGFVV